MPSTPTWSDSIHFQYKWGSHEVNEAWFQGSYGMGSFFDLNRNTSFVSTWLYVIWKLAKLDILMTIG